MSTQAPTIPVAIGLGTNLGDRHGNLRAAVERLAGHVDGLRCSGVWASDAMLLPGSPADWAIPFLNAVVVGRTRLGPHALLSALQAIELEMGRGPHRRWSPRTIDLDILSYGDRRIDDTRLRVPHRGIAERPFVLLPLAELWPRHRLPGDRICLAERAAAYRAEHPGHLPFHAHPVPGSTGLAIGA